MKEQWTDAHKQLTDMEAELNGTASQIASLNAQIRTTLASGGTANELIDQRNALTTTIAALAGGTVRDSGNGMVDVLIDGNAIVSGDLVRPVKVAGGDAMGGRGPAGSSGAHRPGTNMAASGEIAGVLSVLAPAADGGILASAAEDYNKFARKLASAVNAEHHGRHQHGRGTRWATSSATTPTRRRCRLRSCRANAAGIATGAANQGNLDSSIADKIAQLGTGAGIPRLRLGKLRQRHRCQHPRGNAAGRTRRRRSLRRRRTCSSPTPRVDLDEENLNLLAYQHAYQGAARVMTAIDEMLDTLINRTGIVGR